MRMRTWKTLGRLLFAAVMGTPLFVSMPAEAATRTSKVAPGEPTNEVCAQEGCAAPSGDRKLGTAITWMQTPDAAWRAAMDEGKLVFLIQVSGNFARQEFT